MARPRFQVWLDIRDMRAEELAQIVGVSHQAVDRWLVHGIPKARIQAVAQALDIEAYELQRFVDADIAQDNTDYSQDQKQTSLRSLFSTRPQPRQVDTVSANSRHQYPNEATSKHPGSPIPPSSPSAQSAAFTDRRIAVDRRRRPALSPGTPSRRLNNERRNTNYRNTQSEYWWLKVDYLDGGVEEPKTPLSYFGARDSFRELTVNEAAEELQAQFTGTDSD